jgi:Tol biopolymer transport system component
MLFIRFRSSQGPHDLWNSDTIRADNPGLVAKNMGGTFAWMPDSHYVIASAGEYAEEKGYYGAKTVRISGDGTRQIMPIPTTDFVSDVSPDGQWLLVTSNRHRDERLGWQLYRMRLDGSNEQRLTKDGSNVCARFSPDGQRIVYVRSRKVLSLQVLDLETLTDVCIASETDRATNAMEEVCWSPDGKRLCVVRFDHVIEDGKRVIRKPADSHFRLELMDPDGSNARPLELENAAVIWCGRPDWR